LRSRTPRARDSDHDRVRRQGTSDRSIRSVGGLERSGDRAARDPVAYYAIARAQTECLCHTGAAGKAFRLMAQPCGTDTLVCARAIAQFGNLDLALRAPIRPARVNTLFA